MKESFLGKCRTLPVYYSFDSRVATFLKNWNAREDESTKTAREDGWVVAGEKRGDRKRLRRVKS